MRTSSPIWGLPVAALAVAGVSFVSQDPSASGNGLSRYVGVVDVIAVSEAYPRFIDGMAGLQKLKDELNAGLSQERQRIDQLELDIMAFDPSTQDYRVKTLERELAQRRVAGLIPLHEQRIAGEYARLNVEVYTDIEAAIAKVAEARGVLLVLRVRHDAPNAPLEMRMSNNDRRTVLYSAPELDLSQDVINMLKAARADGKE